MADDFRGPAARSFDWVHIIDRHSDLGLTAKQRTSPRAAFFTGLTEKQIRACVRRAWGKRSRVQTRVDPGNVTSIRYRGTDSKSGQVIEFWFDAETQIVKTAYPAGD